ncbi:hypothetical protein [Qipengyuania gaetbuli]|uniref:hypothetical protein n=1 Tax=Qipengyuania gaetbuli TaxID=266952 RepID=UPI001CD4F456|nr:hypothetical protein [Qipengyuania gaetbuli]MCA0910075.1 hypothetical protein [Qipengyuania gaetbuli]
MSYPALSKADAKRILTAYRNGEELAKLPAFTKQLGSEADWDEIADELFKALEEIKSKFPEPEKGGGYRKFEILAGIAAHRLLPIHPATADPDFWTWLLMRSFVPLVLWRYGETADAKNFGLGGAQENFMFRLWLRADIGFDPVANSYELAELGDIDFWRSHIFRQSYGDGRSFARALIQFQFPGGSDAKARLTVQQIRDFAKHLKKARSNLAVEVLDEMKSAHLIEREWAKLAETTLQGS